MTYTEAVEKAQRGDTTGFDFLYNETKSKKYYLALKYVKNEEAAQDVLQDAYLKAWRNLDRLKEPEKFDSWLAQIVVNTAKNELEKRNHTPLDLRAEGDEEENTEVFDRTVSSWENVPELAYTREETRQLVHELIDSLSDEQRIAVIAFELEGLTTKEIAEQLDCSEATVKSRLRYGRNNIKEKAEELQKKGYKLYSVAPVALFLYLFREDMAVYVAEPATQLVLEKCGENIIKNIRTSAPLPHPSFLSTVTGKVVVGMAAVMTTTVAVGVAVGIHSYNGITAQNPMVNSVEQSEENATAVSSEAAEKTESVPSQEPEWSNAYSLVLQHIQNNTLDILGDNELYGFADDIYHTLTEREEPFEYTLTDLDKDGIPELLVRANTSQITGNGMQYWMVYTYQKVGATGQYRVRPLQVQDSGYPVVEGIASAGGARVFIRMNETMDEVLIISMDSFNGDTYLSRGYMEQADGNYWWREEQLGHFTYEQTAEIDQITQNYPGELSWKSIKEPLAW